MKVLLVILGLCLGLVLGVLCLPEEVDLEMEDHESPVHIRSKRSPVDPVLGALVLGKTFLLGLGLGKHLRMRGGHGHGWRRVYYRRPVQHVNYGSYNGWKR